MSCIPRGSQCSMDKSDPNACVGCCKRPDEMHSVSFNKGKTYCGIYFRERDGDKDGRWGSADSLAASAIGAGAGAAVVSTSLVGGGRFGMNRLLLAVLVGFVVYMLIKPKKKKCNKSDQGQSCGCA